MPEYTLKLRIPKPLGNETVSRAAFNEIFDTIDQNATSQEEFDSHLINPMHIPYAVATGSANSYAVTITPAPPNYVEGMAIAVKIPVDNTGPSTLNVNGMGPKPIKKPNGNDVSAGNLNAGSIYTLRYNGANFILQGEGGGGNAQPGDVLSGKTFTNDAGEQVGTMPNRGAMIITPGTSNITIPVGYHNGSGYVKGDQNLVASNIKQGVSIFGVLGTLKPKYEAMGTLMVPEKNTLYTVSGLSFTPTFVIITFIWYTTPCLAMKGSLGGSELPTFINTTWIFPGSHGNSGNPPHEITFLSNGFRFRSSPSHYGDDPVLYTWRALA